MQQNTKTPSTNPNDAIGVFDSGIGGLTVVQALNQHMPNEHIVYFGDTARVPYGVKSPETITRFALQITRFLLEKENLKLLIIACNSMSAVAIEQVKKISPVPVLEVIGAGAKNAVEKTVNRTVGIIGTPATIKSKAYPKAIVGLDAGIDVIEQACPLFVPLVEEGWTDNSVALLTAWQYLEPMLNSKIDTLVLGCTHYPLLKPLLGEIAGKSVNLVDSAQAIAAQASDTLEKSALVRTDTQPAYSRYYVTDAPELFTQLGSRFLSQPPSDVNLVSL